MNNSESDYGIISNKEKTDYVKTFDRGKYIFCFSSKIYTSTCMGFFNLEILLSLYDVKYRST